MSDKTHMHGDGESYSGIVPAKQPNKSGEPPAEAVEGRPLTKENMDQPNQYRTQKRGSWSSKLAHVREAARKDKKLRFTALLHHVTVDLLRDSFFALKRGAAPGVDGVTWQEYGSISNTMRFRIIRRGWKRFGRRCDVCGCSNFGGAVSVVAGTGNASWSVWAICFLRFVFYTHIPRCASTPNIQGKNRVREQRSHNRHRYRDCNHKSVRFLMRG